MVLLIQPSDEQCFGDIPTQNSRVPGHQAKTLAGSYKLTSLAGSHSRATEWLVGFSERASIGGWRLGRNGDLGPAETKCALIQDSAVSILRPQRPQSTQMTSGSVIVEALGVK